MESRGREGGPIFHRLRPRKNRIFHNCPEQRPGSRSRPTLQRGRDLKGKMTRRSYGSEPFYKLRIMRANRFEPSEGQKTLPWNGKGWSQTSCQAPERVADSQNFGSRQAQKLDHVHRTVGPGYMIPSVILWDRRPNALEPSTLMNTPRFNSHMFSPMSKTTGDWRLLIDLSVLNAFMYCM